MMPTTEGACAEAIHATVKDLQTGLALMPRDLATRHIDQWHDLLQASDRADLQQIAAGLEELKAHLHGEDLDARMLGSALADLGRQTVAAAQNADSDDTGNVVERLGQFLLHAGHALRGPFSS